MTGTKAGGLKAAATNKKKYGDDFYKTNGAKGGRNGHTGGFAANPALAKVAGSRGGRNSRKGWKLIDQTADTLIFKNTKTDEIDVVIK